MRGDEAVAGLCTTHSSTLNGSEPITGQRRAAIAEAVDQLAARELAGHTPRDQEPFTQVCRTPEGAARARAMTENAIRRYRSERRARRPQATPAKTNSIDAQRALQNWRRWAAPALVIQITEEITAIETALEPTNAAQKLGGTPQAASRPALPEDGWG